MAKTPDIEDVLGDRIYSTYEEPDPEPLLTDDGLLAVLTPKNATLAVDSEDDDAFAALEDDLSPGEAQRVLNTMRPLSAEEEKILDETPGLSDLRKVDDAEQEKWLLDRTRDGYRAMDKVLEDSVYGEDMDHEEKLERLGLDSATAGDGIVESGDVQTVRPSPSRRQHVPGISGDDSLGAAITEILSGPAPSRAQTTADKMVAAATAKLRSGNPIQPGELAVLARLASAGNPGAKALYANLMKVGTTRVRMSGSDSGDWFYKLNPMRYVTKTSEERTLEDKEREGWSKNADLQKQLAKRQEVLSQAEKAAAAQAAVKAAQDQAVATEQQLKAIEASLSGILVDSAGAFVGSFVGHEKPTTISKVVSAALEKAGKEERASELYDKILSKKALSKEDVADVRAIAKILHREKVVHGDLIDKDESTKDATSAMHGAFVGTALCAGVQAARRKNAICGQAALVLQRKIGTSGTLSGKDARAAVALDKQTKKLRDLVHAHTSGKATSQLDRSAALQRSAIVGAAKAAMTSVEKQQLARHPEAGRRRQPASRRGLALASRPRGPSSVAT